jgi:hypothetical protein
MSIDFELYKKLKKICEYKAPVKLDETKMAEATTIKKEKYTWGNLRVISKDHDFHVVIHPEDYGWIKGHNEGTFKDEQGIVWKFIKDNGNITFKSGNKIAVVKEADLTMNERKVNEVEEEAEEVTVDDPDNADGIETKEELEAEETVDDDEKPKEDEEQSHLEKLANDQEEKVYLGKTAADKYCYLVDNNGELNVVDAIGEDIEEIKDIDYKTFEDAKSYLDAVTTKLEIVSLDPSVVTKYVVAPAEEVVAAEEVTLDSNAPAMPAEPLLTPEEKALNDREPLTTELGDTDEENKEESGEETEGVNTDEEDVELKDSKQYTDYINTLHEKYIKEFKVNEKAFTDAEFEESQYSEFFSDVYFAKRREGKSAEEAHRLANDAANAKYSNVFK